MISVLSDHQVPRPNAKVQNRLLSGIEVLLGRARSVSQIPLDVYVEVMSLRSRE